MEEEKNKSKMAQKEEEILEFWKENDIFKKSLEQTKTGVPFVFYDGPPFATGLPHYGHLLQGTLKDAIPRYQTMNGRYVRRVWGWDCHGLPVENLVEKELGLEHKKDIEEYGIGKFNAAAKDSVLRYDSDWKKIVPRMGRFVDMEESYKTMDWKYTESVWWAFKTLYDKGLVYEGYKPMHICPRCETTLAASEVTLNYRDMKDISATVKFELEDEPGTFVLAWTTTPWTLPGNVALAVDKGIAYCKIAAADTPAKTENKNAKLRVGEFYILAKDRLAEVLQDEEYRVMEEFYGEKLLGKSYAPLFPYYAEDENLPDRKNGWKIYHADFVTIDTGTGVVHIAPAFGEDDMNLGHSERLPFVQHVKMDGTFAPEVKDFPGLPVKKKDDTQSTDVEMIKYLAAKNLLFAKEKIEHSYPLCWRCDTPLLNYAASSWFVKVTAIRDEMVKINQEISWVPENIRDGRFGKWLEGARDWAISRSRYWGAPIPVWKCGSCGGSKIVGAVSDLRQEKEPRNSFFYMRHGESDSVAGRFVSSDVNDRVYLTAKGREEVERTAKELKKENFDVIFSSDLARTKETAEIVADAIGMPRENIVFDPRLREIGTGTLNGKSVDEYHSYFSSFAERFVKRPEGGESIRDVRRRAMDFLFEIDAKYFGKKILVVAHEYVVWMSDTGSRLLSDDEAYAVKKTSEHYIETASVTPVTFAPFPHNSDFELDLHRPYIDDAAFACECGGVMKRVPEVFDCWFESGSMPYAQFHYPFQNKEEFNKNFPAEFIAEAVDQTRGWFYNMLALSVGLFSRPAFENVITTGIILAEDGQKMSKKLRNYPDPMELVAKYGADALRLYLLGSPVVHGEDLCFSEKHVDEIFKKMIVRLQNVVSFYELYGTEKDADDFPKSAHILDEWIFARFGQLNHEVVAAMKEYRVDAAIRPIGTFIDDLSTWYLQNSRERLKGKDGNEEDAQRARKTLRYVLREFSKILAPFAPFAAEDVFQKTKNKKDAESVHLERWPAEDEAKNDPILTLMEEAKKIVSLGLLARAKGAVKVRQPLRKITLREGLKKHFDIPAGKELLSLISERVNVKDVEFGEAEEDAVLDFQMTDELREEGALRELVRTAQELRKKEKLNPNDRDRILLIQTDAAGKKFLKKWENEIKKTTLFAKVSCAEFVGGEACEADDYIFSLKID